MKLKTLRKKIRRLEKRLQEGPKKLAKLKQKLQAAETAKAMKSGGKSTAKPARGKKGKRKLNLSPERRAQLAAAMKARWAAKRASTGTNAQNASPDHPSAAEARPQASETGQDGA